jgi:hypothetical protein
MVSIGAHDPRAVAAIELIHAGDGRSLERLLVDHPEPATARVTDLNCGDERTNRVGHDDLTPLDAATRSDAPELAERLRTRGARRAAELA